MHNVRINAVTPTRFSRCSRRVSLRFESLITVFPGGYRDLGRWGYLTLQSLRIKTGAGNRYGLKAKYIIPPVPVITRSRRFEMTV